MGRGRNSGLGGSAAQPVQQQAPQPQPVQQPAPQPAPQPQPAPAPQPTQTKYEAFLNGTDHDMAVVNGKAKRKAMPSNMYDSPTQRLINQLDLHDKPEIVTSAKLQQMAKKPGAVVLYRTLADGQGMTSSAIAQDMLKGSKNNIGGWGGQAYGGGLYFAKDYNDSKWYGNGPSASYTVAAVLNSKAKVITAQKLKSQGRAFLQSHPEFAKSIGYTGGGISTTLLSPVALAMGYNVIDHQNGHYGYHTILDRSVITTDGKNRFGSSYNDNSQKL